MNPPVSETEQLQRELQQGFAALNKGDLASAAKACQQALKIRPDLVQAHFLTGLVALEAQQRKTAFEAFVSVTKLDSNHAAAWAQLARLYMSEGQVNKADQALQEALKQNSKDPIVQDLLGITFSLMGEHDDALACFRRANKYREDYPPFMLNLANNLVYHGNTEEAEPVFRRIIELQPNSPQAHWALAAARKAKDHRHVGEMARMAAGRKQHPRSEAFYWYAIGKELEDLQEWQDASEAFSRGAAARRQTIEYDEAAEIEMFDYLTATFDSNWYEGLANGEDNTAPIFVLGQPRTGTTLVERIISSHSQVTSAGELQQLGLAVRRIGNYTDPKRFSKAYFECAKDIEPGKIGALYMQTVSKMRGDTPRFVDKLPQNYLLIPIILKALPGAKIVHLVRDPMDACFASFKQLFADAYLHSYDQAEMARHHVRYLKLMDTWRQRFPGQFFDISYEDTARELEPNARRLIEYLDLPWEDACLSFHEQEGAVSTASAAQVREPAHTRSIGRWRHYQERLTPMQDVLKAELGISYD
jgi:tetratricopeptide (TPR) repeat protein